MPIYQAVFVDNLDDAEIFEADYDCQSIVHAAVEAQSGIPPEWRLVSVQEVSFISREE
jgi:hypothetical protein